MRKSHLIKYDPEAHGPQRSPECTAMKAIFSQNTVNVACKKKIAFSLPWMSRIGVGDAEIKINEKG